MRSDLVKMILTYGLAYITVVFGLALLWQVLTNEIRLDDGNTGIVIGAIITFVSAALTFTFQSEIQKQTARQQESALKATPGTSYANGYAAGQQQAQTDTDQVT